MSSTTAIPLTEQDITPEWLAKVTGDEPKPGTVSVNGNAQAGVGFLSNLCRVSFQTMDFSSRNILVKLLPSDPEYRALAISEKFDERELQFYSIVLPQLLAVVPELGKNFCKYFNGNYRQFTAEDMSDHASMLIIEDLKPLGYQMMSPDSSDWEQNLEQVLQFLATFHFSGMALEKAKGSTIPELFPFCMGIKDLNANDPEPSSPMLMGMFNENLQLGGKLSQFLAKHGAEKTLISAYETLTPHADEIFVKILKQGGKFPSLIHGDVWPPNVMVVKNGAESNIKVIDWQLLGFKDPSFEITVAILTSLPMAELTAENANRLGKMYYQAFLKRANDMDSVRSEDEFFQFYKTWGMGYAFLWFVLSFVAFPTEEAEKRLFAVFKLLEEKYRVAEFLLENCGK